MLGFMKKKEKVRSVFHKEALYKIIHLSSFFHIKQRGKIHLSSVWSIVCGKIMQLIKKPSDPRKVLPPSSILYKYMFLFSFNYLAMPIFSRLKRYFFRLLLAAPLATSWMLTWIPSYHVIKETLLWTMSSSCWGMILKREPFIVPFHYLVPCHVFAYIAISKEIIFFFLYVGEKRWDTW